jgi:broad specificity phosphatase PhoE
MRLYFARHGESEANVLKIFANTPGRYGLTVKGKEQAANLARNLADQDITRAFASPLLRAHETAQIVCEALGIDFETIEELREFSVGDHEGASDQKAWDEYREVEEAWLIEGESRARIGGGECFDDIALRFVPFIESLEQRFGDTSERILLIGHGGTFACMLPLIFDNVDRAYALDHHIANAAPIEAEWRDGTLHCLSWNGEPLA